MEHPHICKENFTDLFEKLYRFSSMIEFAISCLSGLSSAIIWKLHHHLQINHYLDLLIVPMLI